MRNELHLQHRIVFLPHLHQKQHTLLRKRDHCSFHGVFQQCVCAPVCLHKQEKRGFPCLQCAQKSYCWMNAAANGVRATIKVLYSAFAHLHVEQANDKHFMKGLNGWKGGGGGGGGVWEHAGSAVHAASFCLYMLPPSRPLLVPLHTLLHLAQTRTYLQSCACIFTLHLECVVVACVHCFLCLPPVRKPLRHTMSAATAQVKAAASSTQGSPSDDPSALPRLILVSSNAEEAGCVDASADTQQDDAVGQDARLPAQVTAVCADDDSVVLPRALYTQCSAILQEVQLLYSDAAAADDATVVLLGVTAPQLRLLLPALRCNAVCPIDMNAMTKEYTDTHEQSVTSWKYLLEPCLKKHGFPEWAVCWAQSLSDDDAMPAVLHAHEMGAQAILLLLQARFVSVMRKAGTAAVDAAADAVSLEIDPTRPHMTAEEKKQLQKDTEPLWGLV